MANRGGEDYLDKALDQAQKFAGKKSGHPVDPAKYRKQNEKITDKLRSMFEKATGKKASSHMIALAHTGRQAGVFG